MINRRSQQAHNRLKRWVLASTWVRSAWDKSLGASKGLGHACGVVGIEGGVESWEVVALLLFDVLGEVGHQGLNGWDEFWGAGLEVLELLELFLDLKSVLRGG